MTNKELKDMVLEFLEGCKLEDKDDELTATYKSEYFRNFINEDGWSVLDICQFGKAVSNKEMFTIDYEFGEFKYNEIHFIELED
jgi:hypothetical protein